jgi:SAM-dependent methyltransferase
VRDDVLRRWVKQPPVNPNVQYLRDAERTGAWELLGEPTDVLDVASEASVTAGLYAESVARVDFSPAATDRAREVLGEAVESYETVRPEAPTLPFADDRFDGAVCVGPYDWTFLDVEALTAELHRVTAPSGVSVFSVPTPHSPYFAAVARFKQRVEEPIRRNVTTPSRRRDLLLDAQFDREHDWLHIDDSP